MIDKKMRLLIIIVACFIYNLFTAMPIHADYVLPYPSYMPGNKLYVISRFWDEIQKYWYFGNISGVKYNLSMSDKYLVEAQTLFEYKQYKLAVQALEKSNEHFTYAVLYVVDVTNKKEDQGEQKALVAEAAKKHTEVIDDLRKSLPKTLTWQEEKKESEEFLLEPLFIRSKTVRYYGNQ